MSQRVDGNGNTEDLRALFEAAGFKVRNRANPLKKMMFNYNNSSNAITKEVSDAKILTENFKNEIFSKLDITKSNKKPTNIKYYLGKLIEAAQTINGVQKNNLRPNGNAEQNKMFDKRIQEKISQMKGFSEYIGSDLNIVQDEKTGLYKLSIDGKLYDIPERKVEIINVDTEDGIELMPEIVD